VRYQAQAPRAQRHASAVSFNIIAIGGALAAIAAALFGIVNRRAHRPAAGTVAGEPAQAVRQ
jgi:hypothetical protein